MSQGKVRKLAVRFRLANQARFSHRLAWFGVVFGFLTLTVAVGSIESANWVSPQPSLITALGLAVVAGAILASIRVPGKIAFFTMVLIGLGVMVWQAARLFAPTGDMSSLQLWWQTVSSSRPADSTVYFAMFLTFTSWVIGFVSAWYILKEHNAWPAAVLGTVVLLVNLSNLPRDMYYFFPLYFLFVIITVATVSLAKWLDSLAQWKERTVRRSTSHFSVAVFSIAVIAVSIAYFVPVPELNNASLKVDMASFSRSMEELSFNIFASVPSKWKIMKSREQEELLFKDPIESSNKVYFLVDAGRSDYWRTRRYDVYESWGWRSIVRAEQELRPAEPVTDGEAPPDSRTLTYVIENRLKTDVVLSAGEVVSTSIPVRLQSFSLENPGTMTTSQGEYPDTAAIVSTRSIRPYELYRVVANFTTTPPEELSRAGENYPEWVTGQYLQLPESLPVRVRRLSEDITQNATTPYDKVMALKNYLGKFNYDPTVKAPPESSDGVDYFLFSTKGGVCTNFASALAVMSRCAGIPARISTGYFRGEQDKATGKYIIRGRNAHAWVEVYFPKYGWTEFEATPASPEAASEGIITSEGYNLSFSDTGELPPWMMEGYGPYGVAEPAQIEYPRRTLPWPYIYFFSAAILLAIAVFIARESMGRRVRRLSQIRTATDAYDRLCYLANIGNSGPFSHETPLEFSLRLNKYLPGQKEVISDVVQAFLATKYGPKKELDDWGKIRLQKAWVQLCPSLVSRIFRLRKLTLISILWSSR